MAYFTVEEKPACLIVRFHAPDSGNALSIAVARELGALPSRFKKSRKPVIVTSSHPNLFCSGGNLSDYAKLKGKAPGLKINREIQKHLKIFAAWPVVKLAVIEGDVFGGGMEWLGYFDYRWASPYARFAFWQKRIGLSPGWGGGTKWSARVGESAVRGLLVEGRLLGSGEAYHHGLVDRVVSSWKILDEAERWCSALQGEEPTLLRWNVKSETKLFAKLWLGPAHRAILKRWK